MKVQISYIISGIVILLLCVIMAFTVAKGLVKILLPVGFIACGVLITIGMIRKEHYNENMVLENIQYLYDIISGKSNKDKIYKELSIFDRIYCINLERSIDRRKNILNNIKNNNLKFIKAVDGANIFKHGDKYRYLDDNYTIDIKLNNLSKDFKPNTIGCTVSHLLAIYTAYVNNDNMILIIEDDIFVDLLGLENINISKYIHEIPDNYEFVSLYQKCWTNNKSKYYKYFNKNEQVCEGTLAYIINKKGINKIVNKLMKIDGHYITIDLTQYNDNIFSDYIIPRELISYAINKSIIIPSKEGFITTITDINTHNDTNASYVHKDTLKRLKDFL